MKRHFESFMEGFKSLVEPVGAPSEFAEWTTVWMLGAAVERRVWTFTRGRPTWPNIYCLLVAPPGFGKGLTIEPARSLVSKLGPNRTGASSMTAAAFGDMLREGHRTVINKKTQQSIDYYGINVISPELQVLIPEYDPHMLSKITDIWDGQEYSEARRFSDSYTLERTFCSILGGTTPEHIFATFPESAFRTGFFSRTLLVWGTAGKGGDIFGDDMDQAATIELEKKLFDDLKIISEYEGQVVWSSEARDSIRAFDNENKPYGGDPMPSHARLLNYCTRRSHHLVKLMMSLLLDEGRTDLFITQEIYNRAYNMLIAMEKKIPLIFDEIESGGESQVLDDVHAQLTTLYMVRGENALTKSDVVNLFLKRMPAYKIDKVLEMAVEGGYLKKVPRNPKDIKSQHLYIPLGTKVKTRHMK